MISSSSDNSCAATMLGYARLYDSARSAVNLLSIAFRAESIDLAAASHSAL